MDIFEFISFVFVLVLDLLANLFDGTATKLLLTIGGAVVLSTGMWYVAHMVALNFNRQFYARPQHHVYCSIAAIMTFFCVLIFIALDQTRNVAMTEVMQWETKIRNDHSWWKQTFIETYDAVYELKGPDGRQLEDFAGHPHPSTVTNMTMPSTTDQSRELVAKIYADRVVKHFKNNHPMLSAIFWKQSKEAEQNIRDDMEQYFTNNDDFYEMEGAVKLAAKVIGSDLMQQVPRVVWVSRIALIILFMIVQLMTFGLMARAALADIKEPQVPVNVRSV